MSQRSSHTVPQTALLQISTRPLVALPPLNLTVPVVHVRHLTPASSEWLQWCTPSSLARQSMSLDSFPRQLALDNQICPAPLVNPKVRATAPAHFTRMYTVFIIGECNELSLRLSLELSTYHKAIQTKLSLLSPPTSEFLIVALKSEFRVQQNLCFVSNKLCRVSKTILAWLKESWFLLGGNRRMQVSAVIPFWMWTIQKV